MTDDINEEENELTIRKRHKREPKEDPRVGERKRAIEDKLYQLELEKLEKDDYL